MKQTKKLKGIIIITIILAMILIFSQAKVYASEEGGLEEDSSEAILDTNKFNPGGLDDAFDDAGGLVDMGATLIGIIRVIGIIVTVVTLMILGIKYMTGSVQEKADYKKTMIPYLIGAILIFGASAIAKAVIAISENLTAGN